MSLLWWEKTLTYSAFPRLVLACLVFPCQVSSLLVEAYEPPYHTLSPDLHTHDWTQAEWNPNILQTSAAQKPLLELNAHTSACTSPLWFSSCSTWALDHGCKHSAVTWRHTRPGPNSNHVPALWTFVWWCTQKLQTGWSDRVYSKLWCIKCWKLRLLFCKGGTQSTSALHFYAKLFYGGSWVTRVHHFPQFNA